MASIFLSPSVQEYNKYLTGGDEEQYMNLIADAMMPYLEASGIYVTRNDPDEPLSAAIAASNAGVYDLHLALHSNASPESLSGQLQGPDVYYYRDSIRGQEAATVFANNLKWLYPIPDLVTIIPNTTLAELRRVTAPAVLLELAYRQLFRRGMAQKQYRCYRLQSVRLRSGLPRSGIRYSLISDLRHFAYLHGFMVYFYIMHCKHNRDIMKVEEIYENCSMADL